MSATTDPARVLRILKRLLRVTLANGATANEAEVAAATARRLLDKHGLSIEAVESLRDDPSAIAEEAVDSDYRLMPRWYTALAGGISYGFEVESVSCLAGPMTFVGFAADVAVAAYLFRVLVAELPRAADVAACRRYGPRKQQFKRGFLLGAAHQITRRLAQSRRRPERQGLIVLKSEIIDRHLGEMKTHHRKPPSVDEAAYLSGRSHGNRVCLDGRPLPSPEEANVPLLQGAVGDGR